MTLLRSISGQLITGASTKTGADGYARAAYQGAATAIRASGQSPQQAHQRQDDYRPAKQ
jgi:hypothetical protein